LVLLVLDCATGCQTFPFKKLPAIEPPPASFQPRVEHAVSDFTFRMNSANPKTSTLDGRLLSNEIMRAWQQRGYITDATFVSGGSFSGSSDYRLTLGGSQHNVSNFWLELLNAITAMLYPYVVTREYDLHYVLETRSGMTYEATVQASDRSVVDLLFLLTLPFMHRGHDATVRQMGDHLYAQFYRQGAFQRPETTPETP
jgi:hypothetical protein